MVKLQIKWDDLEMVLDHSSFSAGAYLDTIKSTIIIPDDYVVEIFREAGVFAKDSNALQKVMREYETITGEDPEDYREAFEQILNLERDESGRYLKFPVQDSRDGFADMEAYIESLENEQVASELSKAIKGKKVFRRFKDVLLNYPDTREAWFIFERERKQQRIAKWLKFHDIEVEFV